MTEPRHLRPDEYPAWDAYFSDWLQVHATGNDEADRIASWRDFLDHCAVDGEFREKKQES